METNYIEQKAINAIEKKAPRGMLSPWLLFFLGWFCIFMMQNLFIGAVNLDTKRPVLDMGVVDLSNPRQAVKTDTISTMSTVNLCNPLGSNPLKVFYLFNSGCERQKSVFYHSNAMLPTAYLIYFALLLPTILSFVLGCVRVKQRIYFFGKIVWLDVLFTLAATLGLVLAIRIVMLTI